MQTPGTPSSSVSTPAAAPKDRSAVAVISLILGICGLLAWLLPICGVPVSVGGLVTAVVGRQSSRRGMATAGLVLSIIGLVLALGNAALGAYLGISGQLSQ